MLAPCWRFILFAQGLGFAPQLFGFSLDPLGLPPQALDLFVGGFVLPPWRINIGPIDESQEVFLLLLLSLFTVVAINANRCSQCHHHKFAPAWSLKPAPLPLVQALGHRLQRCLGGARCCPLSNGDPCANGCEVHHPTPWAAS